MITQVCVFHLPSSLGWEEGLSLLGDGWAPYDRAYHGELPSRREIPFLEKRAGAFCTHAETYVKYRPQTPNTINMSAHLGQRSYW